MMKYYIYIENSLTEIYSRLNSLIMNLQRNSLICYHCQKKFDKHRRLFTH